LNERLELAVGNDVASLGGYDCQRSRFLQSEGASDRKDPVAHFHAVRVAKLGCGERAIHIDLDYGKVRFLIHTNQLSVMTGSGWRFVLQLHADAVGFLDHVTVGDDVSLAVDDDARSQRTLANVAGIGAALAAEKFVEEILEAAVVVVAAALIAGIALREASAAARALDGGLSVDIYDASVPSDARSG